MHVIRSAAISLVAFVSFSMSSFASDADAILGPWWTPDNDGQFEIYITEDGKYSGKFLAGEGEPRLDDKNPDPELRTRSLVGVNFLADFTFDADKAEWVGGTIYDPNNGRTYDCKMWLDDEDPTKLNARGFVGIAAFGRTEVFTRVEDGSATQAGE